MGCLVFIPLCSVSMCGFWLIISMFCMAGLSRTIAMTGVCMWKLFELWWALALGKDCSPQRSICFACRRSQFQTLILPGSAVKDPCFEILKNSCWFVKSGNAELKHEALMDWWSDPSTNFIYLLFILWIQYSFISWSKNFRLCIWRIFAHAKKSFHTHKLVNDPSA